jgi:hypothetical protein
MKHLQPRLDGVVDGLAHGTDVDGPIGAAEEVHDIESAGWTEGGR